MPIKAFQLFLHIVIWLAVYLLPFFVNNGKISIDLLFSEPGTGVHILSTLLLITYAYLNHYLLIPRFYLHRKYFQYVVMIIASVLIITWFPHVFRPLDHHDPMPVGPPAGRYTGPPMGEPPHGGPPQSPVSKLTYNIILFVICTFASISIRQQRQLLEMQQEKLNAELSFLKAQINPHFLFNTLNSIYALSITKSDDTPNAIIQLSELMRYILKDANADTVPLEKELSYISNYVALQKQRLEDTVQISYTAPEGTIKGRVAPLILTSFVENAFKHGVNPSEESVIRISVLLKENQLHFSVINNKVTSNNQQETMGIGLKNAGSRLEYLYPGKHQLTIEDRETTFSVNLILDLYD